MNIIARKEAKTHGLKTYFTGKNCIHGHISYRFVTSGRCSECDRVLQSSPEYRAKRRVYEQTPAMKVKRSIYNKTPKRKASLSRMQKESYQRNKPAFLMRLLMSRIPRRIQKKMDGCSTCEKLGYTLAEFKERLESQFTKGMSWDNHGEWHIDHITPVSKHKNIDRVNDLSNLQPLWAFDNLSKGCKWPT